MRLFIGLLLTVLYFGKAQSALPATANPESNYYSDFDRDFKITLPEKWQVQRQFMGLDVFAAAPPENEQLGSRANISVISSDIEGPISLENYVNKNLENLKKSLTDFKMVETGKLYFDGTEAQKLVYTHKINNLEIKVAQYFVLNGKKGYIITYSAASDVYPKYIEAVDQTIKSFKLL